MPRRPATTVLLLTRQAILRADFTARNEAAGVWTQMRPEVPEWPLLVERALALGPRAGSKVFVLCSDLWTQTLMLAGGRMSNEELASALNFEAEALSGLSAFESTVAVQGLPEGHSYWIVQARRADYQQVEEIVHAAGARLGGLAHPAGLPAAPGKTGGRWARMEHWPDAVVLLRGDGEQPPEVQVLNADPQMGRWRTDWTAWCQGIGATEPREVLLGPGMAAAVGADSVIALDDDAQLARWLKSWVETLTAKSAPVPLFRPAPRPLSATLCWSAGLILAVLVAGGCWSLHRWLDQSVQAMNAQLKHLQDDKKLLDGMAKQIEEAKAKQKELTAQIASIEQTGKVLALHRQRYAKLLTSVRDVHPADLHVDKIDTETGEPRLHGHCLQTELADQFASRLAQAMLPCGWEVQSPKKTAVKIAQNGAPWAFDLQFKSAKEMTIDTRVEPTRKGKR